MPYKELMSNAIRPYSRFAAHGPRQRIVFPAWGLLHAYAIDMDYFVVGAGEGLVSTTLHPQITESDFKAQARAWESRARAEFVDLPPGEDGAI